MNEENGKNNKSFEYETNNLIRSTFNEKESTKDPDNIAAKPSNQLINGLLGWYSVSSSESIRDGKLNQSYKEEEAAIYMKNENIDLNIEISTGNKSFTAFTMDFTNKYIEINSDYRS